MGRAQAWGLSEVLQAGSALVNPARAHAGRERLRHTVAALRSKQPDRVWTRVKVKLQLLSLEVSRGWGPGYVAHCMSAHCMFAHRAKDVRRTLCMVGQGCAQHSVRF